MGQRSSEVASDIALKARSMPAGGGSLVSRWTYIDYVPSISAAQEHARRDMQCQERVVPSKCGTANDGVVFKTIIYLCRG